MINEHTDVPKVLKPISKSVVVAVLPRAGFGNKLFVWARALVFARANAFPMYVIWWNHLGRNLFSKKGRRGRYVKALNAPLAWTNPNFLRSLLSARVYEPVVAKKLAANTTYIFDSLPDWRTYFEDLRPHRELIRSEFKKILKPSDTAPPFIGMHIRLGDFKSLDKQQPFHTQGSTRTPIFYFQEVIKGLRSIFGNDKIIHLFSDGTDDELEELLIDPMTRRFCAETDVHELAALAEAKVIVLSASSTFGLWAAFLSEAIVIHHPEHFREGVRGSTEPWEGPWSPSFVLQSALRALASSNDVGVASAEPCPGVQCDM